MGKLMHSTQIQHSSHPHLLQLSSNIHLQNQPPINCSGCNLQISSSDHHIYTCRPCNFFLHPSCSKFPELITHPSHPQHTLSLLPSCIYPGGFFRCDACTQQGNRFSYHCQICDFDLHVLCASKPLLVTNPSHPHPLQLTFTSPYGEKVGFSCDLCRNVGSGHQWLYRCVGCEFDAHLHCATAKPVPPPLQHHHSLPNQSTTAAQPLVHSMSTGHVQGYWQQQQPQPQQGGLVGVQSYQNPLTQPPAVGVQSYQNPLTQPPAVGVQGYQRPLQAQPPAMGVQSYQRPLQAQPQPQPAVGVQSYQMQPQVGQNNGITNGLGNAMLTGFMEGVMQQVGQDLVQGLTDGGGGNGGGDGGNINIEISTTNDDQGCDNY